MKCFAPSPRLWAILLVFAAAMATTAQAESDDRASTDPEDVQSTGPAQPSAWTPARLEADRKARLSGQAPATGTLAPRAAAPAEGDSHGGAVFSPFSASAEPATAASPRRPAQQTSQNEPPAIAFTFIAILAGMGALRWLLRRI